MAKGYNSDDDDDMDVASEEQEYEEIVANDNEMEIDEYGDDNDDEDMDEDDIDDELALSPDIASTIKSLAEKRELLAYKRNHTEVEWEEKMVQRSELIGRKVDLERLKRITKSNEPVKSTSKQAGKKNVNVSKDKKSSGKGKQVIKDDIDDDEIEDAMDAPFGDDDSDDDLFNSDEVAKYSAVYQSTPTTSSSSSKGGKKSKAMIKDASSDDAEEEDDDDDDDDDDVKPKKKTSASSRKKMTAKKASIEEEDDDGLDDDSDDNDDDDDDDDDDDGYKKMKKTKAAPKRLQTKKVSAASSRASIRNNLRKKLLDDDSDDDDASDDVLEDGEIDDDKKSRRRSKHDDHMLPPAKKSRTKDDLSSSYVSSSSSKYHQASHDDEEDHSGEAMVDDYLSIQLRRHILLKWLHEPFFKEAVEGSFVRVFVGHDRKRNNEAAYRMAEVVSVEDDGALYRITTHSTKSGLGGEMSSHTEHSSIRLTLAIGRHLKKNVKLTEVSDKRIEAKEFKIYGSIVGDGGLQGYKLLTKKQVENRKEKIVAATRHVYTDAEIKAMVARKQGMNNALVTNFHRAMISLRNKRQRFVDEHDYDKITEVDKTIEKLEKEIKLQRVLFDKATAKFTNLNRRNREGNFKKDVEAGMKRRQEVLTGQVVTAAKNPYLRRETRPTNLWNTGEKLSAARAGVEVDKPSTATASSSQANPSQDISKTTSSSSKQVSASIAMDNTVTAANMIFSIDEIRARFQQQHGFDPIAAASINPRDRYLMRKGLTNLPPKGSAEREAKRGGMSIQAYVQRTQGAAMAAV